MTWHDIDVRRITLREQEPSLYGVGVLRALVFCLTALFAISSADAGSFRGGTVSWLLRDPANAPLTVEFTIATTWDNPTADVTDVELDFGDGSSSGSLVGAEIFSGTTGAYGNGYSIRRVTIVHAYAAAGEFTAVLAGCCRHPTFNNSSPSTPYRVESFLKLGPGARGSAVMLLADPQVPSLAIPMQSPSPVTSRLSTIQESGLDPVLTNIPSAGAPIVSENSFYWQLQPPINFALVGASFAVSIVVSGAGGTASSTIDFIFEILHRTTQLDCRHLSSVGAVAGTGVTFSGMINPNANVRMVAAPSGSVFNGSSVEWTPQPADEGTYGIVSLLATEPTTGATSQCWSDWLVAGIAPGDPAACNSDAMCSIDATCTPTFSGRTCVCHLGYAGDGRTCTGYCILSGSINCSYNGWPTMGQICHTPGGGSYTTCGGSSNPVTPVPPDDQDGDDDDGGCNSSRSIGWPMPVALSLLGLWMARRRPRAI